MQTERCPDCPLTKCGVEGTCKAIAFMHRRYCEIQDPARPDHDAGFAAAHARKMCEEGGAVVSPEPEWEAPEGPSLAQRALNFGKAVASHVLGGMHRVDEATHEMRLAKCRSCPGNYWRSSDETCQHPSCGCYMRVKTCMAEQRCPIGEWEAVDVNAPPPPPSAPPGTAG